MTNEVESEARSFVAGIALTYRLVPTNRSSWRMIRRPALVVGAFAAIVTALFTVLTPQFVGSLQIYGAFVAALAAIIWLSFVSQAVLIGAAWVVSAWSRKSVRERA